MAHDPYLASIAKSVKSIALVMWITFWLGMIGGFVSIAWSLVALAALSR